MIDKAALQRKAALCVAKSKLLTVYSVLIIANK